MKRMTASLLLTILLTLTSASAQNNSSLPSNGTSSSNAPVKLTLPNKEGAVRFLVIGDTGTGSDKQEELAQMMLRYRQVFPFEFALMLGDNMYGSEKAPDYKRKFENIYRPLLDQKVKFYAALGNHDESNQRFYELFNMEGQEYYRFKKETLASMLPIATTWTRNSWSG